jgi:hypothetical protein
MPEKYPTVLAAGSRAVQCSAVQSSAAQAAWPPGRLAVARKLRPPTTLARELAS